MASSSVSQESVDQDHELEVRRLRARKGPRISTHHQHEAAVVPGEAESKHLKDRKPLHKVKVTKDKRKVRRRAVAQRNQTESTGESLEEEISEVIDADNPQTPDTDRRPFVTLRRSKSPSDLEADLEDNQDYDSTVDLAHLVHKEVDSSDATDDELNDLQTRCQQLEQLLAHSVKERSQLIKELKSKDQEINRLKTIIQDNMKIVSG